jgi:hypothetical protein
MPSHHRDTTVPCPSQERTIRDAHKKYRAANTLGSLSRLQAVWASRVRGRGLGGGNHNRFEPVSSQSGPRGNETVRVRRYCVNREVVGIPQGVLSVGAVPPCHTQSRACACCRLNHSFDLLSNVGLPFWNRPLESQTALQPQLTPDPSSAAYCVPCSRGPRPLHVIDRRCNAWQEQSAGANGRANWRILGEAVLAARIEGGQTRGGLAHPLRAHWPVGIPRLQLVSLSEPPPQVDQCCVDDCRMGGTDSTHGRPGRGE